MKKKKQNIHTYLDSKVDCEGSSGELKLMIFVLVVRLVTYLFHCAINRLSLLAQVP